MIPKYPYRVVMTRRLSGRQWREEKSFEGLSAMVLYGELAKRKQDVVRVEFLVVLEAWSKGEQS